MNTRALLALALFLSSLGAAGGAAYWLRTPEDPTHAVGVSDPCDAGLCAMTPNKCALSTIRGGNFGVVPDGGTGVQLLKSCYYKCAPGEEILEFADAGEDPIPCKEPKYDGGPYRCVDGGIPWMTQRDLCDAPQATLPPGVEAIDEYIRNYREGEPRIEVWAQEDKQAPWRCNCEVPGTQETEEVDVEMPGPCYTINAQGPDLYDENDAGVDGGSVEAQECPDATVWIKQTVITKPTRRIKMPCATWMGVDTTPAACRKDECLGRQCGPGRLGGICGPQDRVTEEGVYQTCVENKYVRECNPEWQCGKGKWYKENCGTCPEPPQDPDAGLCYRAKCEEHDCISVPVRCEKVEAIQ